MTAPSSFKAAPPAAIRSPVVLGIAAALPLEAQALRRSGDGVLLEITGMGAAQAAAGARRLVRAGASALLSWGTAAGLMPDLRAGAVALPRAVIDVDGRHYTVDAAWHGRMLQRLSDPVAPITAPLAACGEMLRGPDDKRALHHRTAAAVADMESGAVAQVAAEAALPFLVLRVVLDPAAGVLPACIRAGPQGELALLKLLLAAAMRPGDWPPLLRLAGWYGQARRTLQRVARQGGGGRFGLEGESGG